MDIIKSASNSIISVVATPAATHSVNNSHSHSEDGVFNADERNSDMNNNKVNNSKKVTSSLNSKAISFCSEEKKTCMIAQIKNIFPNYGDMFITACLEVSLFLPILYRYTDERFVRWWYSILQRYTNVNAIHNMFKDAIIFMNISI